MSKIKVNSLEGVGASTPAITIDNASGTCTANLSNRQNRNLIINGAMQVAQRGTSSTSNDFTLDRWYSFHTDTGNTVTTSQVAITSGGAYDDGFRKAAKLSLSGAGTLANTTEILFYQKIEAQDLANSGWNYKSASSFVTLSFWVKASTAQAYAAHIRTEDGTKYLYAFTYTVAQANVWQKITKTIPGNSNITIDDDNGSGLRVYVGVPAVGNNFDGATPDTWILSASDKFPPIPSTWLTAGASTFELTGVQLEVGSVATDFEHRSFAQEQKLCERYFHMSYGTGTAVGASGSAGILQHQGTNNASGNCQMYIEFPVEMRANPTLVAYSSADGATGNWSGESNTGGLGNTTATFYLTTTKRTSIYMPTGGSRVACMLYGHYTASAEL